MSRPERRRDVRHAVQVTATLVQGKKTLTLLTENVSFRGLFLRTDEPPALRQLMKVEILLPAGKFNAMAMVVWVMEPKNQYKRAPGVGLQWYGLGKEETAAWLKFVTTLKEAEKVAAFKRPTAGMPVPHTIEERLPAPRPQTTPSPDVVMQTPSPTSEPEPIRRLHPRYAATFKVKPRSVDRLLEMYTRDISAGGMFLATPQDVPVGSEIRVEVIHPDSKDRFALACVVRRVSTDPARRGLGVEFVDVDDLRREEFYAFIHSGIPEPEDDPTLVEEDVDV